jgi:hypothetical protein
VPVPLRLRAFDFGLALRVDFAPLGRGRAGFAAGRRAAPLPDARAEPPPARDAEAPPAREPERAVAALVPEERA